MKGRYRYNILTFLTARLPGYHSNTELIKRWITEVTSNKPKVSLIGFYFTVLLKGREERDRGSDEVVILHENISKQLKDAPGGLQIRFSVKIT